MNDVGEERVNVGVPDENFEKEIDKIDGNSKKDVSWLVHGSKGNKITINVYHPKGGRTSKEIKLIR